MNILRQQSGIALVMTLLAVSFLIAITVQLMTSVNWQMVASRHQRDGVVLDAAVHAGLNVARAALLADQRENEFDSPHDEWATLDPEILADLMGGEKLDIVVEDLSGKLQVNALVVSDTVANKSAGKNKQPTQNQAQTQRTLWIRFLTSGMFAVEDEEQAILLVDALVDWLDADDEALDRGAESSYYRSLDPPYVCKNGPVQSLEELLLVKGMTPEILYGNEEHSGIIGHLTISGEDGKININTAPPEILLTLADNLNEELVQLLIDFREDPENREVLEQASWYRQVSGFPGDIALEKNAITVSSSFFAITSTAYLDDQYRRGIGIIQRTEDTRQMLVSWRLE